MLLHFYLNKSNYSNYSKVMWQPCLGSERSLYCLVQTDTLRWTQPQLKKKKKTEKKKKTYGIDPHQQFSSTWEHFNVILMWFSRCKAMFAYCMCLWIKALLSSLSLKGMHASSLMQLQHYGMCSTSTEEVKKCLWRIPMMDVNSSGAELPAAMNVAPATSSLRLRRCEKGVRDI